MEVLFLHKQNSLVDVEEELHFEDRVFVRMLAI